MGSSLIQAYIATWGALIEEKTLTADSATIQVSNIPGTWKYLHIFANLRSDQAAGEHAYYMEVSDGIAVHSGTFTTITPPNVVAATNYNGQPAWRAPALSDNVTNMPSEWVISQDPSIVVKYMFNRGITPTSDIYIGQGMVALPGGETYITLIRFICAGAVKFLAGSKIAVYGLN